MVNKACYLLKVVYRIRLMMVMMMTINYDDDDNLSGFLLGLAISRAVLGGSWVLSFHH